jgi:hypothetical protein
MRRQGIISVLRGCGPLCVAMFYKPIQTMQHNSQSTAPNMVTLHSIWAINNAVWQCFPHGVPRNPCIPRTKSKVSERKFHLNINVIIQILLQTSLQILFSLLSLFRKNKSRLMDHVDICVCVCLFISSLSLVGNGSVKIPLSLLGNG